MNTFSDYKEKKAIQGTVLDILQDKLNSMPKGDMGLCLITDDYLKVKNEWNREWRIFQEINKIGTKKYKKEILAEIKENRNKKVA